MGLPFSFLFSFSSFDPCRYHPLCRPSCYHAAVCSPSRPHDVRSAQPHTNFIKQFYFYFFYSFFFSFIQILIPIPRHCHLPFTVREQSFHLRKEFSLFIIFIFLSDLIVDIIHRLELILSNHPPSLSTCESLKRNGNI